MPDPQKPMVMFDVPEIVLPEMIEAPWIPPEFAEKSTALRAMT